jgi:hypothetical protein
LLEQASGEEIILIEKAAVTILGLLLAGPHQRVPILERARAK